MRRSGIALLTAALLAPAAVFAAKIWERDWLQVTTEHFVIASSLSETRSIAVATELEHFRAAAAIIVNAGAFEERIPTKLYVLPRSVSDIGLSDGYSGYFSPGMRANYAVILADGEYTDEILRHEYVHFLLHNIGSQQFPAWFDEGFAEVLSTLSVRDNVLEYGLLNKGRVQTLSGDRWMSFPKLIETRAPQDLHPADRGRFYAQSWLLTQYLMIGRENAAQAFTVEATDFIRRSEAGEPVLAAFEAAFGLDPDRLESTLVAYARKMRYYRAALPQPLPLVDAQIRPMAADEVAADLGLLALLHGKYAASQEYYEAALEANPSNAVALAGMGDIHKHAKRFDEAERHYALAVAAEPTSGNHELDWGEYFLQRAEDEADPERRRELLTEARRHFARSYAIDSTNPETLDQNGLTYLFGGEDTAKGIKSLEAAHDLLPSHEGIQFDLARAYAQAGKRDDARVLLGRILAWSHSGAVDEIKALLASLDTAAADAPASAAADTVAND